MSNVGVEICKIKLPKNEDVKKFFNSIIDCESDFHLCYGSRVIDAKSIMGLIALDRSKEMSLRIVEKVDGEGEQVKKLMIHYGYVVI